MERSYARGWSVERRRCRRRPVGGRSAEPEQTRPARLVQLHVLIVYGAGMNENTVALVFVLVFGASMFLAGAGWQRSRFTRELADLYDKVYDRVYARASASMFKTAVRATATNATIGQARPRPRAPRTGGRHGLDEETTIVILPARSAA